METHEFSYALAQHVLNQLSKLLSQTEDLNRSPDEQVSNMYVLYERLLQLAEVMDVGTYKLQFGQWLQSALESIRKNREDTAALDEVTETKEAMDKYINDALYYR